MAADGTTKTLVPPPTKVSFGTKIVRLGHCMIAITKVHVVRIFVGLSCELRLFNYITLLYQECNQELMSAAKRREGASNYRTCWGWDAGKPGTVRNGTERNGTGSNYMAIINIIVEQL